MLFRSVVFDGADTGAIEKTPDFVKSLPIDVAMDEGTLVAFEMNNEPLPHWNGGPARLVVPGWTGTYWVKQLSSVRIMPQPEKNFWMATAYRLPKGKFNTPHFDSQVGAANEPITTMVESSKPLALRSVISAANTVSMLVPVVFMAPSMLLCMSQPPS